jgi:hypothetical protein
MSSKLPASLQASEEDIQMMLAAQVHLGTKNCDKTMEPYVYKRRADGEWIGIWHSCTAAAGGIWDWECTTHGLRNVLYMCCGRIGKIGDAAAGSRSRNTAKGPH